MQTQGTSKIFQGFFSKKEKDYFFANLGMLLEAGMTLLDALNALLDETKSPYMKNWLGQIVEDVQNGFSFSKALRRAGFSGSHTLSLVEIGESSGKLTQNLKIVATSEEKNRSFKSKIRGAMLYPVFVFLVTLVVGVVVVWFILPKLSTVFAQMQVELPLVTKWLIAFGTFLGAYGSIVVPGFFIILFALTYILFFWSKTKYLGQSILFGLPGIGRVLTQIELAHMGHILGTLLSSGIPVVTALESLVEATSAPKYKDFYRRIKTNITEGNSFTRSFASYEDTHRYIPPTIERLIASGEKSGKLAETFLKINTYYEEKIDNTTKNLAVIFEPVLLVIVWLAVVIVAMSVILPIYSLIGGFNQ